MKNLTDWFGKVCLINLPERTDKLERVTSHLKDSGMADMTKVEIVKAISGKRTTVPKEWTAGAGAWGLHRTVIRKLEDILQEPVFDDVLFMEDDVVFSDTALEDLNLFMTDIPRDWTQIYLGGQQTLHPTRTASEYVLRIKGITRTQSHAIRAKDLHKVYRFLVAAPWYGDGNHHIDHRLEQAQMCGLWSAYCPWRNISGQEAGMSDVMEGKSFPRRFWN